MIPVVLISVMPWIGKCRPQPLKASREILRSQLGPRSHCPNNEQRQQTK